ncbi:MAG TPA: hypothetical protein VF944_11880 [Candidatus Bathyarchaeia archaeon]
MARASGTYGGSFGFADVCVGGRDGEGGSDLEDESDSGVSDLRIGPSGEDKEIGPTGGSVYG